MLATILYGQLQKRHFRKLGVRLFQFVLFLFLCIYCFLRICVLGEELSFWAETVTLFKIAVVGSAITFAVLFVLYVTEVTDGLLHRRKLVRRWRDIYA